MLTMKMYEVSTQDHARGSRVVANHLTRLSRIQCLTLLWKKGEREGVGGIRMTSGNQGTSTPPGRHRQRRAFKEGACFACAHPFGSLPSVSRVVSLDKTGAADEEIFL